MTSSASRRRRELLVERGHAQLAVAAHDLDQQPLLGAEVVVQQPARARRASRATWSKVEPGHAAAGDARAHRLDDALGLLALDRARCWVAASMARSLAGRPAESGQRARHDEGRPGGRPCRDLGTRGVGYEFEDSGLAGRGRRRRGGRRVVELLLGAEQRVEDLVAQALAQRRAPRRRRRCRRAAACAKPPLALLLLGTLAQGAGRRRAATRPPACTSLCSFLSSRSLRRRLAVGQPAVGASWRSRRRRARSSRSSASSMTR